MARSRDQPAEAGAGTPPAAELDHLPPPYAPAGHGGSPPVDPLEPVEILEEDHSLILPKTRTSATMVGLAVGLILLVLVIVFIAQNLEDTRVHLFGWSFEAPVGLVILGAVVAGGILVLLVSAARVAQLRRAARRHQAEQHGGSGSQQPAKPSRSRRRRSARSQR